jgi:hypothetical protein
MNETENYSPVTKKNMNGNENYSPVTKTMDLGQLSAADNRK